MTDRRSGAQEGLDASNPVRDERYGTREAIELYSFSIEYYHSSRRRSWTPPTPRAGRGLRSSSGRSATSTTWCPPPPLPRSVLPRPALRGRPAPGRSAARRLRGSAWPALRGCAEGGSFRRRCSRPRPGARGGISGHAFLGRAPSVARCGPRRPVDAPRPLE